MCTCEQRFVRWIEMFQSCMAVSVADKTERDGVDTVAASDSTIATYSIEWCCLRQRWQRFEVQHTLRWWGPRKLKHRFFYKLASLTHNLLEMFRAWRDLMFRITHCILWYGSDRGVCSCLRLQTHRSWIWSLLFKWHYDWFDWNEHRCLFFHYFWKRATLHSFLCIRIFLCCLELTNSHIH